MTQRDAHRDARTFSGLQGTKVRLVFAEPHSVIEVISVTSRSVCVCVDGGLWIFLDLKCKVSVKYIFYGQDSSPG